MIFSCQMTGLNWDYAQIRDETVKVSDKSICCFCLDCGGLRDRNGHPAVCKSIENPENLCGHPCITGRLALQR